MTDETENLVRRLLRDIRDDLKRQNGRIGGIETRLEGIDRRLGDLNESAALAMGKAAQSHISQESLGLRLDEMRVDLDLMKERMDEMDDRS